MREVRRRGVARARADRSATGNAFERLILAMRGDESIGELAWRLTEEIREGAAHESAF
jgi:hypothetical protein